MNVESWIQILLAVCTVCGLLFFWLLRTLVSIIRSHADKLADHETRITVIDEKLKIRYEKL